MKHKVLLGIFLRMLLAGFASCVQAEEIKDIKPGLGSALELFSTWEKIER